MLFIDFAMIVMFLFAAPATKLLSAIIPECIFSKHGFQCPACGGTRCTYMFASGRFDEAIGYNAFVFMMWLYIIAVVLLLNLYKFFGIRAAGRLCGLAVDYRTVIAIAVCFAVFGIVRNFV